MHIRTFDLILSNQLFKIICNALGLGRCLTLIQGLRNGSAENLLAREAAKIQAKASLGGLNKRRQLSCPGGHLYPEGLMRRSERGDIKGCARVVSDESVMCRDAEGAGRTRDGGVQKVRYFIVLSSRALFHI